MSRLPLSTVTCLSSMTCSISTPLWITSPCTWTLDTGIGIGSTRDEVLSAYPDAQLESDTADGVAVDRSWEQFYYRAGDL